MRHVYTLILFGFALLAAAEAFAETPACTCRYAGQSYQQGTCACIVTSTGARRACCDKVLNNTSWSFKGETCPIASAAVPPQVAETPQAPVSNGRPASAQAMIPPDRL